MSVVYLYKEKKHGERRKSLDYTWTFCFKNYVMNYMTLKETRLLGNSKYKRNVILVQNVSRDIRYVI